MKKRRFNGLSEGAKLPPQCVDIEEVVLGGIMVESRVLDDVLSIISENCFYKDSHALIFKAISSLYEKKQPVDIITVTAQLKKDGNLDSAGGAFYITQLTERVVSNAHIIDHCRLIAEAYLGREVIRISGEMQSRAFDEQEDIFEVIEELYRQADNLNNYGIDGIEIPLSVQIDERIAEKEKQVKEGIKITGISTGNEKLDSIISGWVKQNLIILAARPGMGKSVKALDYAKACALKGEIAMVFSLEMSSIELIDRFIVAESQIPLHHYRSNNLTQYQLDQIRIGAKKLKKLPILIDDTAAIKVSYVRRKAKLAIKKHGKIGLIIIDYLQLMTAEGKINNREQEVSSISRGLKSVAKELNVPIIALAQVGREAERSNDKRPTLSSLRESGSIEQDADVVMFVYRPAYYFQWGDHPDAEYSQDNISESEYEMVAELLIPKNRNGVPNTKIKEKFVGSFSTFYQYDRENPSIDNQEDEDLITDAPF